MSKEIPQRNRLKNIKLFGDEDEPVKSTSTLELSKITLNDQPRKYFDDEQLNQLAESIKLHGVIQPLVVRPLGNKYEIVAGERRYRASQIAGLTSVPVVIKEFTDIQAQQIALIENLQRVDLNPVEQTEGILKLLSIELEQSVTEVISLLYQMNNQSKKESNQNVLVTSEVEQVFASLGLMSWQSFVTTRLPLLNLPEDILEILREGKIAYTKAIALSKVKDEELRKEITKEALERKLSLRDLKTLISEMTAVSKESEPEEKQTIESVIKSTAKELTKAKLWKSNPQKWKKVEKLIKEINMLLIEEE